VAGTARQDHRPPASVASILAEGGEDPTFVIAGGSRGAASNAGSAPGVPGGEADESDASFLPPAAHDAIVTTSTTITGHARRDFARLCESS